MDVNTCRRARALVFVALSVGLCACGGGAEESGDVTTVPVDDRRRHDPDANDGVQIQGLLGTLSRDEIQLGLEPRLDRFEGCFVRAATANEIVSGRIDFFFRIATDGRVRWVYPRGSNVGDRETERCLLGVAQGARFPRPHGGEAEFTWPIEFPVSDDVRPPVHWDPERVADTVAARGGEALQGCGAGGVSFQVTVYVAPGGRVITAGASTGNAAELDHVDCIVEAVRAWSLPDPGSYPAKVSFELR